MGPQQVCHETYPEVWRWFRIQPRAGAVRRQQVTPSEPGSTGGQRAKETETGCAWARPQAPPTDTPGI